MHSRQLIKKLTNKSINSKSLTKNCSQKILHKKLDTDSQFEFTKKNSAEEHYN
jgi:hypothetical protein